ncbi:NADP-dependent malic enzyme [compost metagenome]
MRAAREQFAKNVPHIECDGEMHGDAALSPEVRARALLESSIDGEANVLICPNLDAANILFNVLKTTAAHGTTIGPMLLGSAAAAHVLTPSSTVRRVVNMTALAAAQAQTLHAA